MPKMSPLKTHRASWRSSIGRAASFWPALPMMAGSHGATRSRMPPKPAPSCPRPAGPARRPYERPSGMNMASREGCGTTLTFSMPVLSIRSGAPSRLTPCRSRSDVQESEKGRGGCEPARTRESHGVQILSLIPEFPMSKIEPTLTAPMAPSRIDFAAVLARQRSLHPPRVQRALHLVRTLYPRFLRGRRWHIRITTPCHR